MKMNLTDSSSPSTSEISIYKEPALSLNSSTDSVNEEIQYFNPYISKKVFRKHSTADYSKFNPYSQSLWYYSRKNNGEEIREMEAKQRTIERRKTLNKLQGNYKTSLGNLSSDSDDLFSEADKENISPFSTPRSKTSETALQETSPQSIGISSQPTMANNSLPGLIEVVRVCIKDLELLSSIQDSMTAYSKQNAILVNSDHMLLLFGNVKTILSINRIFLKNLGIAKHFDVQLINDFLSRVLRVYPSYIFRRSQRMCLINRLENSEHHFDKWIQSLENIISVSGYHNIDEVMEAPISYLSRILDFTEDILNPSLPDNISALNYISKLRMYIQRGCSQYSSSVTNDVRLSSFEVPQSWKLSNKTKWRNINSKPIEEQVIYYLRDEIKTKLVGFDRVCTLFRKSVFLQLDKILTHNYQIATTFNAISIDIPEGRPRSAMPSDSQITPRTELFFENSIQSSYQLGMEKAEREKKQIWQYILKCDISLRSRQTLLKEYLNEAMTNNPIKLESISEKYNEADFLSNMLNLLIEYSNTLFKKCLNVLKDFTCLLVTGSSRGIHQIKTTDCKLIIDGYNQMKKTHIMMLRDDYTPMNRLTKEKGKSEALTKVLGMLEQ